MIAVFISLAVFTFYGCTSDTIAKKELELLNDANEAFTNDKFELSRKYYEKILNEYPDSPFTAHALLGQADSYYMNKEFFLAEPTYASFIEIYPMDALTPRATFYRAMSYYQDVKTIKRDHTFTDNAKSAFEEFSAKYPKNPAREFADNKVMELTDLLAQKEIDIINFYFNTDAFNACIGRVDSFVSNYPDTKYVQEALLLKARSFMEEEAFDKAKNLFEIIMGKYPKSKESAQSKNLIKEMDERKKANAS